MGPFCFYVLLISLLLKNTIKLALMERGKKKIQETNRLVSPPR